MAAPTLESRRRRRALLMSADPASIAAMRAALADGWELVECLDIDELGSFEEILQLRFILIDLDARNIWDPAETIARVRSELMVNVPILCFGGGASECDAARLAGADRFFEPAALAAQLPDFCKQFGW
jgi:hypothetical protein